MRTQDRVLFLYKIINSPDVAGSKPTALVHNGLYLSSLMRARGLCDPVIDYAINEPQILEKINFHKPKLLIIEGTWVNAELIKNILSTYQNIHILLREHARLGFLAIEGSFVEWWNYYENIALDPNYRDRIYLSMNTSDTAEVLSRSRYNYLYLPNYYEITSMPRFKKREPLHISKILNVACFGSLRLMKNQLAQAYAAINAAESSGSKLNFYINAPFKGDEMNCVYLNINALFGNYRSHSLKTVAWSSNDNIKSILSTVDLLLQVSMSESFNFTVCDAIVAGIPAIVSPSINWLSTDSRVPNDDTIAIRDKILSIASDPIYAESLWNSQLNDLIKSNYNSALRWTSFLNKIN